MVKGVKLYPNHFIQNGLMLETFSSKPRNTIATIFQHSFGYPRNAINKEKLGSINFGNKEAKIPLFSDDRLSPY